MLTPPIEVDSGRVTVPVNVGEASGAFNPRLVVTVAAKFASSPRAAASSSRVFSNAGDAFVRTATAASA